MGRRGTRQQPLWIATEALPRSKGDPFYERLNEILGGDGFDEFVEKRCERHYAQDGRPGLAPGRYFRCLLIGYFEGLDSERLIAWRVNDSRSLLRFLGYGPADSGPDHSTISRTRRRVSEETHAEVFGWVVERVREAGLLRGDALGVDTTTLMANASMRKIVRRDSGEGYREYVRNLMKESGIEAPTVEEVARYDRKRRKKLSNREWAHPVDSEACIGRLKDGRTRMAYKAEHAVDLESGAIAAVTVQPGSRGDTETLPQTLDEAERHLGSGDAEAGEPAKTEGRGKGEKPRSLVCDKGYHSDAVIEETRKRSYRSYIAEPTRGRRRWRGRESLRRAVYGNRRRVRGNRGTRLRRRRHELTERSFAHCYETGGMRRVGLRGSGNIRKRLLIHTSAFNLSLLMRQLTGIGKPKSLLNRDMEGIRRLLRPGGAFLGDIRSLWDRCPTAFLVFRAHPWSWPCRLASKRSPLLPARDAGDTIFTTGC